MYFFFLRDIKKCEWFIVGLLEMFTFLYCGVEDMTLNMSPFWVQVCDFPLKTCPLEMISSLEKVFETSWKWKTLVLRGLPSKAILSYW